MPVMEPVIQPSTPRIKNTINSFSSRFTGPSSRRPFSAISLTLSITLSSGAQILYRIHGASSSTSPAGTMAALNQVIHSRFTFMISLASETVIELVAIPVRNRLEVPIETTYIRMVRQAPIFRLPSSGFEPSASAMFLKMGQVMPPERDIFEPVAGASTVSVTIIRQPRVRVFLPQRFSSRQAIRLPRPVMTNALQIIKALMINQTIGLPKPANRGAGSRTREANPRIISIMTASVNGRKTSPHSIARQMPTICQVGAATPSGCGIIQNKTGKKIMGKSFK